MKAVALRMALPIIIAIVAIVCMYIHYVYILSGSIFWSSRYFFRAMLLVMTFALGSAVKFSLVVFFYNPANTGDKASDSCGIEDRFQACCQTLCVYLRF